MLVFLFVVGLTGVSIDLDLDTKPLTMLLITLSLLESKVDIAPTPVSPLGSPPRLLEARLSRPILTMGVRKVDEYLDDVGSRCMAINPADNLRESCAMQSAVVVRETD